MSPLLYAVTDGDPDAIEGTGIDGRPLRAVACEGLVAVVGEVGAGLDLSEEHVWRYEETVEGLMSGRAILPARFGSVVDDDDAARAALRARRDELAGALEEVRGAVELAVRAIWSDGTEAPGADVPRDGTDYMLGRLKLLHRAERIAGRLEPLGALARRSTQSLLVRPSVPILGSYLVDDARVAEFGAAVRRLDAELAEVSLSCSGPWPPYSFTGEGDG